METSKTNFNQIEIGVNDSFDWDLTSLSELGIMSINKERIEKLESSYGDLQNQLQSN